MSHEGKTASSSRMMTRSHKLLYVTIDLPPTLADCGLLTGADGQIVSTLYLMAVIGVICFIFFIVFRKGIKLYQTRLVRGRFCWVMTVWVCTQLPNGQHLHITLCSIWPMSSSSPLL
jgi:hypothetical protein